MFSVFLLWSISFIIHKLILPSPLYKTVSFTAKILCCTIVLFSLLNVSSSLILLLLLSPWILSPCMLSKSLSVSVVSPEVTFLIGNIFSMDISCELACFVVRVSMLSDVMILICILIVASSCISSLRAYGIWTILKFLPNLVV